jgi:hypothetical protein
MGFVNLGAPLPLSSLTTLGVQAETVRQLSEMKVYLLRQFGLDLSISREVPAHSQQSSGHHLGQSQQQHMSSSSAMFLPPHGGGPMSLMQPRMHGPDEVSSLQAIILLLGTELMVSSICPAVGYFLDSQY